MKTFIRLKLRSELDNEVETIATIQSDGLHDCEIILDRDGMGGIQVTNAALIPKPELQDEFESLSVALEGFRHKAIQVQMTSDEVQHKIIAIKRMMGWEG